MSYGAPHELGPARVVAVGRSALLLFFEEEPDLHEIDDGIWIPFSVMHENSELFEGCERDEEGKVIVKFGWAEKRGIV